MTLLIEGFQDGIDFVVLAGGLTFDQLTISPNATVPAWFDVSIASSGELLATLAPSLPGTTITAADFITA